MMTKCVKFLIFNIVKNYLYDLCIIILFKLSKLSLKINSLKYFLWWWKKSSSAVYCFFLNWKKSKKKKISKIKEFILNIMASVGEASPTRVSGLIFTDFYFFFLLQLFILCCFVRIIYSGVFPAKNLKKILFPLSVNTLTDIILITWNHFPLNYCHINFKYLYFFFFFFIGSCFHNRNFILLFFKNYLHKFIFIFQLSLHLFYIYFMLFLYLFYIYIYIFIYICNLMYLWLLFVFVIQYILWLIFFFLISIVILFTF